MIYKSIGAQITSLKIIFSVFIWIKYIYPDWISEDLQVWRKLLTSKWSKREENATESNFADADNATKTLDK